MSGCLVRRDAEFLAVKELVNHTAKDLVNTSILDHVCIDQMIPEDSIKSGKRRRERGNGPPNAYGNRVHIGI